LVFGTLDFLFFDFRFFWIQDFKAKKSAGNIWKYTEEIRKIQTSDKARE